MSTLLACPFPYALGVIFASHWDFTPLPGPLPMLSA